MRLGWIAVCALAVVGGFVIVMRIAVMLHLQGAWVAYPAELVGAVFAGWVLARQGRARSWAEPAIGGLASVAVFAVVAFAPSRMFDWGVVTPTSWLLVVAMALATAVATAAGAWFADPDRGRPGVLAIATLATFVTAAILLVLVRVMIGTVGLKSGSGWPLLFVVVIGALGAFTTQLVVPHKSVWVCSCGLATIILIQLVDYTVERDHTIKLSYVLAVALAMLPGLIGASIAWRLKPKRTDDATVYATFD